MGVTINNTLKVEQPALFSSSSQDDCKTIKYTKLCITKQGQNTEPPPTNGRII